MGPAYPSLGMTPTMKLYSGTFTHTHTERQKHGSDSMTSTADAGGNKGLWACLPKTQLMYGKEFK